MTNNTNTRRESDKNQTTVKKSKQTYTGTKRGRKKVSSSTQNCTNII